MGFVHKQRGHFCECSVQQGPEGSEATAPPQVQQPDCRPVWAWTLIQVRDEERELPCQRLSGSSRNTGT